MRFRLRNIADKTLYPLTGLIKQVGRGADCDIVIPNPQVSRLHARLERAGEGWVILDLESRNGTAVNGEDVKEKVLNAGDVIQIGNASLKYEPDDVIDDPGENTKLSMDQQDTPGFLRKLFPRPDKK